MYTVSITTMPIIIMMLVSITRGIFKESFKKDVSCYLPIIAIVYGMIISIIGYYVPSIDVGENLLEAILFGVSTGATACGINQVPKQLSKKESSEGDDVPSVTSSDSCNAEEFVKVPNPDENFNIDVD